MKARDYPQMRVRLPPDLDRWLEHQAKLNRRSKTAEVATLMDEARKGREKEAAGQASQA